MTLKVFFIYFITRARLTETTLTLAYLHKDRPIEQTIPLENLVITLGRRREKNGRSLEISIYQSNKKIVIQSQHASWSNDEIWKLYSEYKSLKNEALSKMDQQLKRVCIEGKLW